MLRARVIYQNAAHQLRSNAEKLRAILPARGLLVDQTQIRLVNQRGCLQRMAGPLVTQVARRLTPQLVIDHRNQRVERSFITVAPRGEQLRDVACLRHPEVRDYLQRGLRTRIGFGSMPVKLHL